MSTVPVRQVERGLMADGVARAVAIGRIVRVVEKRVGGLVAFEVDDAEGLAAFDFMRPRVAGGNDLAVEPAVCSWQV